MNATMYDIELVQTMSETHCHSENADGGCRDCGSTTSESNATAESSSSTTETTAQQTTPSDQTCGEETNEMLGQLPPEIAMLLIVAGIAGIALPGPVGTPMLIAGCVMMWPKTFQPIERWFSRRCPRFHHEGVIQIKEFVADLQRRFPDGK